MISDSLSDAATPSPPKPEDAPMPTMPSPVQVPSSREDNVSTSIVSEKESRPVWGKASNGTIDAGSVIMGGSVSWPALTESSKTTAKASSEGVTSAMGQVNSRSAQQKAPMRGRGGYNYGDGVGTSGSFYRNGRSSSSTQLASSATMSKNNTIKTDTGNYSNHRDRGSRESHGWVDHGDRQRKLGGSNRRGNDWNRRDQDRSFHELTYTCRVPNSRDFHKRPAQPRLPAMQPPIPSMMPFVNPLPYPSPMVYPDFSYQGYYFPVHPYADAFVGSPFVTGTMIPPMQQTMFFAPSFQHHISLLRQIEYYFSMDNLCKDVFLRRNMDEQGWVSVFLIADFNRVKKLTNNIQLILHVLRASDVVEVKGDKVRRRYNWGPWILNSQRNQQHLAESGSLYHQVATKEEELLAARMEESVTLGDGKCEGPLQPSK